MGKVIVDISRSVDGYAAGHAVSVEQRFADAGHCPHQWLGFGGAAPTPTDLIYAVRR